MISNTINGRSLILDSKKQSIRVKMKEMGDLSGVPIEPDEQTKLLDTCVSQAGVIGGGVPGGMFPDALERLD
jgi:phosphomevalonate kinase